MVFICLAISQDHVIQGSCDFKGITPTIVSHTFVKFADQWHRGSGNVMV